MEQEKSKHDKFEIKKIINLIDLTSLNDNDTIYDIEQLCYKSSTPFGDVASVCVFPKFVTHAKNFLKNTSIHVCSVANFPSGNQNLKEVIKTIEHAFINGCDEIDVVFPYQIFLSGDKITPYKFIEECKRLCNKKILKIILETGAFPNSELIAEASKGIIFSGANFLKTSTGKIKVGATEDAVMVMLRTIKSLSHSFPCGIKISGGIKSSNQAFTYLDLVSSIMGSSWVSKENLRFGTSQLLDDILKLLINYSKL